jgi:hypothetical protein
MNPRGAVRSRGQAVLYPAGSLVVCNACGVPLYRLQRNIWEGEKTSGTADRYAPVDARDVRRLMVQRDLEPGVRAAMRDLAADPRKLAYLERIPELRNGELPDCPACGKVWVRVHTSTGPDGKAEFIDRAYTWTLAVIYPEGGGRRVA